jgi:hypothetical protein
MVEETKQNGKATVVITYNSVKNYPAGTYEGKNGNVIIYSNENHSGWEERAQEKLESVMHGIYGRLDSEDVKHVYLYVGRDAKNGAEEIAQKLSDHGKNLTIVACDCQAESKKATAKRLGVPIIWSDCGGRYTLEWIVKMELNQ